MTFEAEARRFAGVRVLIFDLDGTLIDSGLDLAYSVNAALAESGRSALPNKTIFSYVGDGAAELIRRALGDGASDPEVERILAFFLSYYRAHMLDNTRLYPGVREGLDQLAGYSMAVLTNKPVRFSRAILEGLHLDKFFRFVYGGNSFEQKKPDPMGVRTLLQDFGASPSETMVVGDSDVDVRTARNAGTLACGVTYGLGSAGLQDCPPDILLDSLTELPGALRGS
jgi:phosphoglycolate phosphatase